ncbi:MAG: S-layer homology domain-containing protein, partial [Clostridia bacterium]|nr:S-layer homology domain-containing protein [Clostridia bacterium]
MKKRISALVLAIAMLLSVMPTAAATETDTGFLTTSAPITTTIAPAQKGAFTDTEGTYYEEAAQRWADAGVLNGVGDNLFAGGNTAKRGEAAKVIVLTSGIEVVDVPADFFAKFTDVPADAWYAPYIYALYLEGIMQGDGISSMRPEDQLTREEYVTLKGRALGITENKSALRFSSLSGKDEVSDWAAGYMGAFIAAGIIKGDENGYINAQGSIVR